MGFDSGKVGGREQFNLVAPAVAICLLPTAVFGEQDVKRCSCFIWSASPGGKSTKTAYGRTSTKWMDDRANA